MKLKDYLEKSPSWLQSLIGKPLNDIELIKKREGLKLKWYKDSLGKMTGGYGHLQKPGEEKLEVTQTRADGYRRV